MSNVHPFDANRKGSVGTGGPRLPSGGGGDNYGPMEARVSKLESEMTDIKVMLGRIDERLAGISASVATKIDLSETERRVSEKVAAVDSRVGVTEGELRRTLGAWQFLLIMIAAVTVIVKWPAISTALGL